jgi:hypothetical protein
MKKHLTTWIGCLALLATTGCQNQQEETILSREQVLAVAEASPAAVAIHDKQAWLDLFARKSQVEDPVGTEAHRAGWDKAASAYSKQPLDDFYDTFIAPNEIIFHVKQDIVAGNEMIRDVDIETHMGTGLVVVVPTHLRYKVVEEDGEAKIQQLAAHWELNAMIKQVLGDSAGLATGAEMSLRMLEEQGISGALGYLKGMTIGIFGEGKSKVERFNELLKDGSSDDFKALFSGGEGTFEYPVAGKTYTLAQFDALRADISLSLSDLKSAGFFTSARFELTHKEKAHTGIVFFKFDQWTRRIKQVRFFWED